MIYSFLKSLTQLALKVYFKKIHIKGKKNIPDQGPFLIVANHPSSFLDPVSIAMLVKPKISFLAKATMFNNKIIAAILKKLNMVPIYRAQDNPGMLTKNEEVFNACYEKLNNGGVIMIFPEGTSESERRLRKVKTGAARIALGAAKVVDFKPNIKILPVGLNYTKSSRFRSELFIEFGEPIDSSSYYEAYKENEIETAKDLTNKIEAEIKNRIINIDKEEYEDLVEKIESLYKSQLLKAIPKEEQTPFSGIEISQGINAAVQHFQQNDNALFHNMKTKIDDYFLNLKEIRISDKSIKSGNGFRNFGNYIFKSTLILLFGFPLWLFGFLNSYIPYKLPRLIALKITDSEAFYGALLMSIGTFSFILFYSLEIYLTWAIFHSIPLTIVYGVVLPISGFFTILYARIARRFYYNWQFTARFFSKQKLLMQLVMDRKEIITELERIKAQYN